jgi:hypothetical protein
LNALGSVYVGSTAIYSSYTQSFQAISEADRYPGVGLVLGLSPFGMLLNNNYSKFEIVAETGDKSSFEVALEALQETKSSVDAGNFFFFDNLDRQQDTGLCTGGILPAHWIPNSF